MTKMCERQDAAINKLLDRLQEEHEERDRYKKALEAVQTITLNNYDHDMLRIFKLCKKALK